MIIEIRKVSFKGKFYAVYKYRFNDEDRLFVTDWEDRDKMLEAHANWYQINNYIGYKEEINHITITYYLHNLIMDKKQGGGKGQKFTIDHINRNTRDNRKENLRLISQSRQNENQGRRKRIVVLPDDCGVDVKDIPKCVYYVKPNGKHGDGFVLELKKDGARKTWKSTRSKEITLKDKLIQIKKIILDISDTYPELLEDKAIIENYTDQQITLMRDFNQIITLSRFDCADSNLMEIPVKEILDCGVNDIDDMEDDESKRYLQTVNTAKKIGRRHRNNLPKNCGITPDMIPKHCYYQPATDKRGDAFVIDRHPLLPDGQRQWKTTGSVAVSTKNKFKSLKRKLKELAASAVTNDGTDNDDGNTDSEKVMSRSETESLSDSDDPPDLTQHSDTDDTVFEESSEDSDDPPVKKPVTKKPDAKIIIPKKRKTIITNKTTVKKIHPKPVAKKRKPTSMKKTTINKREEYYHDSDYYDVEV